MSTYPGPPTGRVDDTAHGPVLVIERIFGAPVEEVWASFTEPERVAEWYGIIHGDCRAGQTITITMTAEDGSPASTARIIECLAPNRFLVETAGMEDPWRLQIELVEVAGVTTMTFTHFLSEGLGAADVGPGWEFYADRHDAAFNGSTMPDWDTDDYQTLLGPHYGGF